MPVYIEPGYELYCAACQANNKLTENCRADQGSFADRQINAKSAAQTGLAGDRNSPALSLY